MSLPFQIEGSCVRSDDVLFDNIRHACTLGLQEIRKVEEPHMVPLCVVGSGPSLHETLDYLRALIAGGAKVMAIRDAHDFLIERGIIPDFAVSVDPLPAAATCFKNHHPKVHYLIASQSDPAMFETLKDANVVLWHPYMKDGQREPKRKLLIGGHTTSGLRGISVAYVLGYRFFHLFGLDSSMKDGILRINGTGPDPDQEILEVQVERGGRIFYCNPAMSLQAQNFQDLFYQLPDATFKSYGDGLLQAIMKKRDEEGEVLKQVEKQVQDDTISFIHAGGMQMASYRYRAAIPAFELGATINDPNASTLIFSKPLPHELMLLAEAKLRGSRVIADFCDNHFGLTHYQEFLRLCDLAVCPTAEMAKIIKAVPNIGKDAIVIPDPFEYPLVEPHFNEKMQLLWFGHQVNWKTMEHVLPDLEGYNLRVVSNFPGAIPWSYETMLEIFKETDIVLMPASDKYRSPNRTVEAIRQGCFVIAEPHPAIMDIPGIYIGNIKEGLEWVKQQSNSHLCSSISLAQDFVTGAYSPRIVTDLWRSTIQSLTTLEADEPLGKVGSMSI